MQMQPAKTVEGLPEPVPEPFGRDVMVAAAKRFQAIAAPKK
jgi:hypothetical protein